MEQIILNFIFCSELGRLSQLRILDHTGWIQGWIQFNGCSVR
jgi:hypothetical protein